MRLWPMLLCWLRPTSKRVSILIINLANEMTIKDCKEMSQYLQQLAEIHEFEMAERR